MPMMIAAVAHAFGAPLAIEQIPIPEVTCGKILVKIMASGVCHTDLHAIHGDWPIKPELPLIPGHEGTGVVTAVGHGVHHLKEGDRVGIPWLHTACGFCDACLKGWETLCPLQKNTGYSVNGCFAEYVLADARYVATLPDHLDFAAAASILCAGLTVYKGIKESQTQAGDWLAVSGIGGLGHMAVQYAKAMGRQVVALDIHEAALQLAQNVQADVILNVNEQDPIQMIRQTLGGVHAVLATAPSLKSFSQALALLKPGGTLVLIGLPPGQFNLSAFDLVIHGKTLRGSIVGNRLDLKEALAFAAEAKVKVHYTLERLENINHVFDKMASGQLQGRVVLQFHPEKR